MFVLMLQPFLYLTHNSLIRSGFDSSPEFLLDELTDLECVSNQNMFCRWSLNDFNLRTSSSPRPASFVNSASHFELSDQQDFVHQD